MKIRGVRLWLALSTGILLSLLAGGCGSNSSSNFAEPETSLTPTSNPLVAQMKASLSIPSSGFAKVWVEFGPSTSYGRQTSPQVVGKGYASKASILVAGMKADATYHMRAHVEWSNGAAWVGPDQTFTTGSLPFTVSPGISVNRPVAPGAAVAAPQNYGVELLNFTSQGTDTVEAAAADLDGNIIWYYDVGSKQGYIPFPIKLLDNGHMLVNISNFLGGSANGTTLREIDLAGNIIRDMPWSSLNQKLQALGYPFVSLHHDFVPLPNGHLILLANTLQSFTDLPGYPGTTDVLGDVLVDLDANWNPVWWWSAFDHLDINRHLMGLPDWTHGNALVYTSNDGNLLLSMRHQSWIMKIDYRDGQGSGDILWKLGEGGDFQLAGGDPSQWFYAQHFPNLLALSGSQLTLAIVDNGNLRIMDDQGTKCGTAGAAGCYSRAVIFQADEIAKTAALQWQYLPGYFSFFGGSIGTLPNGNVEFDMSSVFVNGAASQVDEVTQTANPQIVWQMNFANTAAYRAYRIPSLYPGVVWTN